MLRFYPTNRSNILLKLILKSWTRVSLHARLTQSLFPLIFSLLPSIVHGSRLSFLSLPHQFLSSSLSSLLVIGRRFKSSSSLISVRRLRFLSFLVVVRQFIFSHLLRSSGASPKLGFRLTRSSLLVSCVCGGRIGSPASRGVRGVGRRR